MQQLKLNQIWRFDDSDFKYDIKIIQDNSAKFIGVITAIHYMATQDYFKVGQKSAYFNILHNNFKYWTLITDGDVYIDSTSDMFARLERVLNVK